MFKFNVGDNIAVLNDTITGKIIRIQQGKCVIEDSDGFERIYPKTSLVVVKSELDYKLTDEETEKFILQKINAITKKKEVKLSSESTSKTTYNQEVLEIDLHIEELVDDHSNMNNFEILQRQMQTCRMFIERAMRVKAKKAILIHGKGEGVLREEIYSYLIRLENSKHIKLDFSSASFSHYGVNGATEVRFL
jgi:dsDNA-specific endonuclease/ATPase MutS2